jgi:hypothetical protein
MTRTMMQTSLRLQGQDKASDALIPLLKCFKQTVRAPSAD